MPLTIKPLLKGSSLSSKSGRQPYHVSGLEGTTPAVMWAALFAAGLPQSEQIHPQNPQLKVIDSEVTEMLGNFDCIVTVSYGPNEQQQPGGGGSEGEGVIEMDSSVVGVKTMIDYGGEPIKVIYNPGFNGVRAIAASVNESGGDRGLGATVDMLVPMITVRVQRVEDGPPLANAKLYVGKVNSTNLFDDNDKQAYLCTRLAGTRNFATTDKYNVTYEFQAPEDGWLKVAGYIDPVTNQLSEKNVGKITVAGTRPRIRLANDQDNQDRSANGLTIVRVQGLIDFAPLNLPTL
jgi:hypothetical protein